MEWILEGENDDLAVRYDSAEVGFNTYQFEELKALEGEVIVTEFRVYEDDRRGGLVAETTFTGDYEERDYQSNFVEQDLTIGGSLAPVDVEDALELYQEILDQE